MTPSQWHDDARRRDAGHDEMQIAVFDYLRDQQPKPERFGDYRNEFLRVGVHFEMPFRRAGLILAWGDVVEVWAEQTQYYQQRFYAIYEIKPKIYSVGAVVRQCIALELSVRTAMADRHSGREPETRVVPVVRSDDAKLPMLRHVFCAAVWDGERLS